MNVCTRAATTVRAVLLDIIGTGVSGKTFEPNISVICQWICMKFKIQIF
jgi:hypothetical protein